MAVPRYMTADEKRLARMWRDEDEVEVAEIARRLHRAESSIWRFLGDAEPGARGVGRKRALTDADKDRLVTLVEGLVKEADTKYTVSIGLIQKRFRPKVSFPTLWDALHERGVWFHKLREKPLLTDQDVKDRFAWAKKYRGKSPAWWRRAIQLHMDNHVFKVPATAVARRTLAARRVSGTYRSAGKSLEKQHVKAGRGLRQNTGARGVLVAGGVGAGCVLLWSVIEDTWCAPRAAELYSGPVKKCLREAYPAKRAWSILEDNDPAGYKAKLARDAKAAAKITPIEFPKHSPDLNVMDFFVWSEIEKRLRGQERSWPADRKETRPGFIRRLRRVARSLTADLLDKAVGDLARRTEALHRAKGGLFEEGARA